MSNIVFVILSTLFVSNVCVGEGLCVPCLVAYKRSFPYTALLCALFAFVLVPAGVAYYFIYNNVLLEFDLQFLSLMIMVTLIGVFSFAGFYILRAINKQAFFVYEKSYTFLFTFVSVLGILIFTVADQVFSQYVLTLVFDVVGFSFINFFVYGAYFKINGGYAPKYMKGLPLMLIMLAVIGLAFSLIGRVV